MNDIHYFNKPQETMSQDALHAWQETRFRAIIKHVYANSDAQRAKFKEAGIDPEEITLADLPKVPTMSKKDFRNHYPLGLCCTPHNQLAEMHMSSGSTGTPVPHIGLPTTEPSRLSSRPGRSESATRSTRFES